MYVLLNGIHTFLLSHHRWRSLTFAAVEAKKKAYVHLFFLFLLRRPFSILSVLAGANYQEKMQRKTQREDTGETISMLLVLRFHGGSNHICICRNSIDPTRDNTGNPRVLRWHIRCFGGDGIRLWNVGSLLLPSVLCRFIYRSIREESLIIIFLIERYAIGGKRLRDRSMLWLIGFMTELSIS